MKRNKVIGIAASVAIAFTGLTLVPASAQAAVQCGGDTRESKWFIEAWVGNDPACYEVEVREEVYNNYGLAGNYTKTSTSYATLNVTPSYAPGTYVTQAFRTLAKKGGTWSHWISLS
jgi:hypothetical protein